MSFYLEVYELLPEFLKRRINPLEYAIRAFVASARPSGERALIVDAGAGEVKFKPLFDGHHYLALDSAVGDRKWDYSGIDVCADLDSVPVRSDSADRVLNIQVLEHVPDPQRVVSELYRVLKPGGRLFLTAPQGWHEHQQPHDHFRFTRYALTGLLEKAGFCDIEVRPLGGYFHYLGHRLTYVPKILFQDRTGVLRAALFPVELLALFLCCLAGPLTCYYLDLLDRRREFTLCYSCRARKPARFATPADPRYP